MKTKKGSSPIMNWVQYFGLNLWKAWFVLLRLCLCTGKGRFTEYGGQASLFIGRLMSVGDYAHVGSHSYSYKIQIVVRASNLVQKNILWKADS
jgi:hypothetical protein